MSTSHQVPNILDQLPDEPVEPVDDTTRDLPIIEQPSLQQARKRRASSVVTFVAWAVWVYIWMPFISLLAWYAGVRTAWMELFLVGNPSVATLLTYLAMILLFGGLLIGWSRYNLHRFGGKDRRAPPRRPETEEMSVAFDLQPHRLRRLRSSQRAALSIDSDGVAAHLALREDIDGLDHETGPMETGQRDRTANG